MEGNSFSIDVQDDLLKARVAMKTDKFLANIRNYAYFEAKS